MSNKYVRTVANRAPKANVATENGIRGVYMPSLLTMKVVLKITEIGRNVKENLERKIIHKVEGCCIAEGFVRPNSVRIISYSSGNIVSENVEFQVSYECMICHPVENMRVQCTACTITKAGIHAKVMTDGDVVPLTVFVARDHNYASPLFSQIKENQTITVRIIGIRYELNDPCICAIGTLIDTSKENRAKPKVRLAQDSNVVEEVVQLGGGDDSEGEGV
jgi:DNA-directed RNA polymerase subunit E'/Rpb7